MGDGDDDTVPVGAVGIWRHSFEDDDDDRVFRPESFDFPLARGREAIEFRPDGTFVDWVVGRGDANEPVVGRWRESAHGTVTITRADGTKAVGRMRDGLLRMEDQP